MNNICKCDPIISSRILKFTIIVPFIIVKIILVQAINGNPGSRHAYALKITLKKWRILMLSLNTKKFLKQIEIAVISKKKLMPRYAKIYLGLRQTAFLKVYAFLKIYDMKMVY